MASLLLTLLLVCVAAPWAEGALKELGQPCTAASDTCVHPTLDTVCDQGGMCRIKEGQACSGSGYSTLCVLGAECTSNTCSCKASVYTSDGSTGKCAAAADKYGGACPSSGSGPCTGTNLECLSSVCLCTQSGAFSPNLADGTCAAIGAMKVGTTCNPSSSPEATTACGAPATTFLECPSGTTACACKTGYIGSLGGSCTAIGQQLVGRTCTAGAATDADKCGTAATTNLGCTGGSSNVECACTSDYYGVMGGACYAAEGTLGGGCTVVGDCSGSNKACTGTPLTCQCAGGYYDNSGTCTSIPDGKVGAECTTSNADTKCPPASNLECDTTTTNLCVCKSGYSGPANGDCSKNSGAVVVGSLVTVTLAAILHVFMRD